MTPIQKRIALRRARKAAQQRMAQPGTSTADSAKETEQRARNEATMEFYMKSGR